MSIENKTVVIDREQCLELLGPLAKFAGIWTGSGKDWAPVKDYQPPQDIQEENDHLQYMNVEPYWQEMQLEPVPLLHYSAADQTVTGLRYLGKIWAGKSDSSGIAGTYPDFFPVYEENGYVLWIANRDDPTTGTIVRQISNPRGLSIMARAENVTTGATEFTAVCAKQEDPLYGILQDRNLDTIYYPAPKFESKWQLSDTDGCLTLYYDELTFLEHPDCSILMPQRDEAVLKKYTP